MNVECPNVRSYHLGLKELLQHRKLLPNLAMNTVGAGLVGLPTQTCWVQPALFMLDKIQTRYSHSMNTFQYLKRVSTSAL